MDRQKSQYTPSFSQDEKNFEQSTEQQREQTYFKNVVEVDSYWIELWETEAEESLNADWIKEIEDSLGSQEEEITGKVEVSVDEVIRSIEIV